MKFPRRKLLGLALTLAAAVGPALFAQSPARANEEAFRRISDKLICQCGCNYGLTNCPHLQCPSAPALRAKIREKLAAGQSEPEVLQAIVAEYGLAILGAPPAEGFNLTAWVMPFVALLLGLGMVVFVARRWYARRAPPGGADPYLLERYRANLEQEIKRLEE